MVEKKENNSSLAHFRFFFFSGYKQSMGVPYKLISDTQIKGSFDFYYIFFEKNVTLMIIRTWPFQCRSWFNNAFNIRIDF